MSFIYTKKPKIVKSIFDNNSFLKYDFTLMNGFNLVSSSNEIITIECIDDEFYINENDLYILDRPANSIYNVIWDINEKCAKLEYVVTH